MRVVSLLPSATETLSQVGAGETLVGRSHECDFPASITDRPVLTSQIADPGADPAAIDRQVSSALSQGRSLYRLDTERLRALAPEVILTQDLCEVCSIDLETVRAVAREMDPAPLVVSLNPGSFEDVLDDLVRVGDAVGMGRRAREELVALRERFYRASDFVNSFAEGPRVVFLEWTDPPFVGGHWTPQLVERAGASHPLNPTRPMRGAGAGAGAQMAHRVAGKSVRVTPEEIRAAEPEAVIVCPCGVGLDAMGPHLAALEREAWWRELPAMRAGRVAIVDGNQMFNRPGPRLVDAYEWLVGWLNSRPELIPAGFPWRTLGSS